MPRTEITVAQVKDSGIVEPAQIASDQANGMFFQNDGMVWLKVVNGDASSRTVTFLTSKEVAGFALADRSVVVVNGTTQLIGPFPPDLFNQVGSQVFVDFSAGTPATVTVKALHLGIT